MNLTDIDLTRAQPIDFDDIREGDTFLRVHGTDVSGGVVKERRGAAIGTEAGRVVTKPGVGTASWFLLDRPSPPSPEPGTTGTATVRGQHGVRVMRLLDTGGAGDILWCAEDGYVHEPDVTDFVADPAPGIPQELRDALDSLHKAYTGGWVGGVEVVRILRLFHGADRDV